MIFAAIGAVCLSAAAYLLVTEIRFKSNAIDLKGVITDSRNFRYAYEYPEGSRHVVVPRSSDSDWNWVEGDTIDIQVDPADPGRAQITGFTDQWLAFFIMALFGCVFGGIGFGILAVRMKKASRRRYLLANGTKIRADISSVGIDGTLMMNGRSPFVIHAEARIDGKVHLFDSDSIWFNPGPYLEPDKIDVYYDPRNPRSYYVDISGLPEVSD